MSGASPPLQSLVPRPVLCAFSGAWKKAMLTLSVKAVRYVLKNWLHRLSQTNRVLQSLETEFAGLKEEMSEMTAPLAELKPSDQRKYNTRKREVRCRIKKQEKLMKGISTVLSAFQQALDKVSTIEGVALILGGSLVRPLFVYDITVTHGRFDSGSVKGHGTTKLAQSVSRKAVRALISCGAGSLSYTEVPVQAHDKRLTMQGVIRRMMIRSFSLSYIMYVTTGKCCSEVNIDPDLSILQS
uniref:Uncharacterized protein n=1 Tax=Aegilops tauschii TaxID=37682 RepID=R7WEA7_AEGTA